MLLKKIVLDNFGIYGNHNEFDIAPNSDRPIVLCGGTNGAGKTTLFESISLCLYGQKSIEPKVTLKQYQQKIMKSFHKAGNINECAISLEFDHAHQGKITQYKIMRSWINNNGIPDETLNILKNTGQKYTELDSMEKSHWQTFIDQLLPKGITKLFFFDGEKIQKIAEYGNEDEHIRASFNTLLGLDLITQLHDDIGLYVLRNSEGQTKKILDDLEQKNKEKQESKSKMESLQEKRVYLQADIEKIKRTIAVLEERFTNLGGQFADNRQELMMQKTKQESGILSSEKNIKEICSDTLPFCLVPEQMAQVKSELVSDMAKIQSSFEKDLLESSWKDIQRHLANNLNYDESTRQDIMTRIKDALDKKIESLPKSENMMFNLSLNDIKSMINLIDDINKYDTKEMAEYAKEYETILDSLNQIKSSLDIAPQQDEIGPLFSEIKKASMELGELEGELENLKNLEAQEKTIIVMLNFQIQKMLTKKKHDGRLVAGLDMASKVQEALIEYAKKLRMEKISLLEANVLDGIQRLFHKKDFIKKISINPETFEVKLFGDDEITRDMLSQGELQIYATAIVWGLAKTSGRPLPFIIDTPLARLDTTHRENLIENFYPYASHQIVIFSTDSEIIGPYYNRLEPHISKSFVLQYDSATARTIQKEGYFNMEEEIEVQ